MPILQHGMKLQKRHTRATWKTKCCPGVSSIEERERPEHQMTPLDLLASIATRLAPTANLELQIEKLVETESCLYLEIA